MTDRDITEAQMQSWVVELAAATGWKHYHTYSSRRSVPGFPDLVLARKSRLIFAELKTATGKLTQAQAEWLMALKRTGAEVYLWRPEHWTSNNDGIVKVLKG